MIKKDSSTKQWNTGRTTLASDSSHEPTNTLMSTSFLDQMGKLLLKSTCSPSKVPKVLSSKLKKSWVVAWESDIKYALNLQHKL